MSLDLFKISDEIYAFSDLYSDHLFDKIPKDKIIYYIKSALKIGCTVADTTRMKYKNFCLRKNCEDRKIKINIIDKEYRVGKIKFRAEMLFKLRHINIMSDSIKQLQEGLNNKFTFGEIVDIHIAHELYHFIEHDMNVKTNQVLDKVKIFSIGGIKRQGSIVKTSEIAAHAYSKELLNLDFHPKALDFEYMLTNKQIKEKELKDYLNKLENILQECKNL